MTDPAAFAGSEMISRVIRRRGVRARQWPLSRLAESAGHNKLDSSEFVVPSLYARTTGWVCETDTVLCLVVVRRGSPKAISY